MAREATNLTRTWQKFSNELDYYDNNISSLRYIGAFDVPPPDWNEPKRFVNLPPGALEFDQIPNILREKTICPPHGLDLLISASFQKFQSFRHLQLLTNTAATTTL